MVAALLDFSSNCGFRLPKALPNREEGEPDRTSGKYLRTENWELRTLLPQPGTATARAAHNASNVAGLARFFPESTPVRMPVQLTRIFEPGESSAANFTESTVIEFGTPREVLFAC